MPDFLQLDHEVQCLMFLNNYVEMYFYTFSSFHLCTHKPSHGHCGGDSGGPLFILNDKNRKVSVKVSSSYPFRNFNVGRHMVVGVCSFANTGDCTSTPGGFARLTQTVLQWIKRVKVKPVESHEFLFQHDFLNL